MDYTIISNYLDYCKAHKRLSTHTLRAYKNDLMQFYNSNNECVVSYIEGLTNSNLKTSTLRRKIASLKVFYGYLQLKNVITDNPFNQLRFQFRAEKTLPKTIPHDSLKILYTYLQKKIISAKTIYQKQKAERNLLIVSLLLSTGIRISELCHIQIKDINLTEQTLQILGKGKKERMIFIGDERTFQLLKAYITCYCNHTDDYLFLGKSPQKPLTEQSVRLLLKTAKTQTRLTTTITPHMFRHSFATMLLDNDVDIRYIQQILGHSSISITQIYTHVSQSRQKEILSSYNPISSIYT
ncbi:TPA: tyrosine-type recombinase/integrase [Streptococcus suis]|nr:tyrosine-type recombinase/integrase [Streptococcus suis]HEM5204466.1 tyrosine-type recombinase/integrase [Streptococcus suis]HEM5214959.1 tyrosine-type recombinase/integrase [Streptococcus suis]